MENLQILNTKNIMFFTNLPYFYKKLIYEKPTYFIMLIFFFIRL